MVICLRWVVVLSVLGVVVTICVGGCYLFVTEVTNPYDWSVFICECRRASI